jgi:hypothetical protein
VGVLLAPGKFGTFVEVLDEHAELGAPVTEVVLPDDLGAKEAQDAGECVADDRGAQVPDVHLLGDVGRRVVDHHPLVDERRADAEPGVAEPPGHALPDRGVA